MMSFNEFKEELVTFMSERYPDVRFEVNDVVKNNGLHLTGIVGLSPNSNTGPNIYINELYERCVAGEMTFGAAATIVEEQYRMASKEAFKVTNDILDYEGIKDKIVCRLVNRKLNRELLQDIPYKEIGSDLAVTYRYLHAKDENSVASSLIKNIEFATWGVTLDELNSIALSNTERMFPAQTNSLLEVVRKCLFEDLFPQDNHLRDEITNELDVMANVEPQLYVLTNDIGLNGATAILYPSVQEQLKNRFGEDFYILPSSIHEVMIAVNCDDESFLLDMVKDANQSAVRMEDYLADSIYQIRDDELVNINLFEMEIEEAIKESFEDIADEFDAEI